MFTLDLRRAVLQTQLVSPDICTAWVSEEIT